MKQQGKPGYAGKISHSGAQYVQAPMSDKGSKGKSVTKKGTDLRAGK